MRTSSGRGGEGQRYALTSDEDDADFWGSAREAEGFFTPLPDEEGARRVRLKGCLPLGGLLRSVGHVGSRRALAGNARFELLDGAGATMGSYFVNDVTVIDVEPSACGGGLVDLTVTLWCENALAGAEHAWDLIRAGRLNRTGMWHELTPEDRHAWLSTAHAGTGSLAAGLIPSAAWGGPPPRPVGGLRPEAVVGKSACPALPDRGGRGTRVVTSNAATASGPLSR
ncbi:hypothetical protein [Streptomyces sp. CS090A]|uniref:hypothetical protein n=1 Tax=Streptomyces sp. CS090A TaxID=2162710 RepID=UPI001EF4D590|nr:hypothetical protein [Streptomyces sp. CS090A]